MSSLADRVACNLIKDILNSKFKLMKVEVEPSISTNVAKFSLTGISLTDNYTSLESEFSGPHFMYVTDSAKALVQSTVDKFYGRREISWSDSKHSFGFKLEINKE